MARNIIGNVSILLIVICLTDQGFCFDSGSIQQPTFKRTIEPKFEPGQPIDYGLNSKTHHRQRLSVNKSSSNLGARELRPRITKQSDLFYYRYDFLEGTALSDLPLFLEYKERSKRSVVLGDGWQLHYPMHWDLPLKLNIFKPKFTLYASDGQGVIAIGSSRLTVQIQKTEGSDLALWRSTQSDLNAEYFFREFQSSTSVFLIPTRIIYRNGDIVIFEYDESGDEPRIDNIITPLGKLTFDFTPEAPLSASRFSLKRIAAYSNRAPAKTEKEWLFDYDQPLADDSSLLTRISIVDTNDIDSLQFSYARLENHVQKSTSRTNWCEPTLTKSSAWKRQTESQNGGRWKLPMINQVQGNIQFNPGLRFMDLDLDGFLDLVNTQEPNLSSWRWDKDNEQWQSHRHIYRPKHATIRRSKRPSASHYIDLPKRYANHRHSTFGYQAMITSAYQPSSPDGKSLTYHKTICFPPVLNGVLDPHRDWDCDDFNEEDEFPPLQYNSNNLSGIWPEHLEGIQGIESYFNQGSQFVQFHQNGKLGLLYIGLRYVDIGTSPEKILLSEPGQSSFRDTQNCKAWKVVDWENKEVKRKVRIDLCQSFWSALEDEWDESQTEPFWRRDDVVDETPRQRYILPWPQDKPSLLAEYHTFRGIKFAQLESGETFAIIKGRDSGNDPKHRAMYHLAEAETGTWLELDVDHPLYFPQDFWRSSEILFANIGGDWADDVILRSGKVYINMEDQEEARWQHCPALDLPVECNPFGNACQLVDLDRDDQEYQDLFIGSGKNVYINQANLGSLTSGLSMTEFTDKKGKQRKVSDLRRPLK